ncbi:MAG TPA: hypothetical protein VMU94_04865 [Streptosporangiaceae bacterium]|nr:hypothetical protein [Streptosporangiaceae bacterium]
MASRTSSSSLPAISLSRTPWPGRTVVRAEVVTEDKSQVCYMSISPM